MKTIFSFHGRWIRGNEKTFLSFANILASCNIHKALIPYWKMQNPWLTLKMMFPLSKLQTCHDQTEMGKCCPLITTSSGLTSADVLQILLEQDNTLQGLPQCSFLHDRGASLMPLSMPMQSRWLTELAALLSLAYWSHPLPTRESHLRRALWSLMVLELLCAIQHRIREYIFIWDFLPLLAVVPIWRFVTLLAFAGDRCWRVSLTLSLWKWVTQWPVHQQSSLCTWCVFSSIECVE